MEREQINYYLQKVSLEEIIFIRKQIEETATVELIQKPTSQTLLVPVKDPINNSSFISGEVLVTSSIVQVNGTNGWSMVLDDNPEQAVSIAILDGAYGADILTEKIIKLVDAGKQHCHKENEKLNSRINSTRVSFDLL